MPACERDTEEVPSPFREIWLVLSRFVSAEDSGGTAASAAPPKDEDGGVETMFAESCIRVGRRIRARGIIAFL
jgi:hypothetical protein